MKEFAMKHPILTFLLVDSAIGGTVAIIKSVAAIFTKDKPATDDTTTEEE